MTKFEAMNKSQNYCKSLTAYQRYKSHEVRVGTLGIGGDNPIRLQSMTTTDTMDTEATVAQSIRMIEVVSWYALPLRVKKKLKIYII